MYCFLDHEVSLVLLDFLCLIPEHVVDPLNSGRDVLEYHHML